MAAARTDDPGDDQPAWRSSNRVDEISDDEIHVCVAAVAAAHGARGLVRLKSFTEAPEDCTAYGPLFNSNGRRAYRVEKIGMHKGQVLVRIEGVTDRTAAEGLRGTRLYIPRSALPKPEDEDEFYHADLIGLEARLADGSKLGLIRAVFDFGAGDSLELAETPNRKPLLVPFTRAVVPTVDLGQGFVLVEPPSGLLDERDAPKQGER